ncbi:MAG TPA: aminotransferase class III-fold pyridoxal phosphate-dependent enzyme [Gemmatimonadaceae bacterium]|nr:aminotransferase class III-fold pyridoxal phosphate-dependent enzyme [Gemmatimonadaceae bacterium]
MLDHAPFFDHALARRFALDLYGVEAQSSPLPSERDQNVLLEATDGTRVVLKIANALEEPGLLEAQQHAMSLLADAGLPVPRVVALRDGEMIGRVQARNGRSHAVWVVTHLPGIPLARLRYRSPALLEDFGRRIGEMALALRDFDHPALHREFHWDLAGGRALVARHRALITERVPGAAIDRLLSEFDARVVPQLPRLRRSAIHGDLNDHNVLVGCRSDAEEGDPDARHGSVTGILDFGDMVHGWTVADLAIAAAYASLDSVDPLATIAALVRGRHGVSPLEEPELSSLFGLVVLRLAMSACLASLQRPQRPDNAYLDASQSAIARTLPRLARIPFGLAEAVVREACGLEPVAASVRVRQWLSDSEGTFAPVMDGMAPGTSPFVVDLSIGSPLVAGDPSDNSEPRLTSRIIDAMATAGVAVGVGRYDEPRLLYATPAFARPDAPDAERRTIHIGLDLFAPAGTPVHAPLAGTVHAFADNAVLLDYGPVIVLRHETGDGTPFHTLYGHLSSESLAGLEVGRRVEAGELLAKLGAPHENVGWTPHLHLQVITDLLGLGTGFPGVACPSQRAVWRSLSPDPTRLAGIPPEALPAPTRATADLLSARRARIGANVALAYREPVRVARGWMQWLYDEAARRYLDAYNNVPHVGHSHPRIVRAASAQMAVLNTNTRYLGDLVVEYAERLTATLPEPLRVAYFLSSASEANELALRLARAFTTRRDMIVLDAAYHGNTAALIDLSPYKHAGAGGAGAPDWVHVAPLPDDYRGEYRRDNPDTGMRYALQVSEILRSLEHVHDQRIAGFIAETCPSVGGQIMLPAGYLERVYQDVRRAGGVCIADEVQTGLGRIGTHYWAFEAHGVVPDIVVMGKPLGNGHPLAAVVTAPRIADSFAGGMEFFSTFGGNTVSCAVGLAVLDVVAEEGLQAHALRVGTHLLDGLRSLAGRHPVIGDVRGSGFFLGVELVRDRDTLVPAPREAAYVVNRMRQEGILLGTDGPDRNVLKIRPPMPFDDADAEHLLEIMGRILEELGDG